MYRILIVDDEPMIVEGLAALFEEHNPWQLEIHTACLAAEALQIMNRQKVDILLTDIRMPAISGIELMEKVRVNWPECRIVFLTAFEEFEYAYMALKNPGVRFLLKTEMHETILKTIDECMKEIEGELQDKMLRKNSKEQSLMIRVLKTRDFFTQVLHFGETVISQSVLNELGIELSADKPVYLLLGFSVSPEEDAFAQMDKITSGLIVRLGNKVKCSAHKGNSRTLVWFIQENEGFLGTITQSLPELVVDELENMEKLYKDRIAFVISDKPSLWENLFYAYQKLKVILHLQAAAREKLVYIAAQENETSPKEIELIRKSEQCKQEISHLKTDMEMGNREVFNSKLKSVCERLLEVSSKKQEIGQELVIELNLLFFSQFNKISLSKTSEDIQAISDRLSHMDFFTPLSLEQYLNLGEIICNSRNHFNQEQTQGCIEKVKTYICNHLDGDLSLSRLASLSNYNPKYLSDLFHAQTGLNLSEYISDKRLEEAKKLLAKGNMKIKDIAAAVGFISSAYFTRFFKKALGITPLQYQEQVLREELDKG